MAQSKKKKKIILVTSLTSYKTCKQWTADTKNRRNQMCISWVFTHPK